MDQPTHMTYNDPEDHSSTSELVYNFPTANAHCGVLDCTRTGKYLLDIAEAETFASPW